MTEASLAPAAAPPSAPPTAPSMAPVAALRSALRYLFTRNPVVIKELRGRMRGPRAFVVLAVYLLLMSSFVTLVYGVYVASNGANFNVSVRQLAGQFVFYAVVGIELLLVCFIAPAFTAGAISGERERQTYDLLRTTLLTETALVFGKLTSALSYILMLLLAALPLQSLAFLLGGVAPAEVVIATLVLAATALLFATSGVFFSSLMKRTLSSTVMTYAFALMATLGLPLLLVAILPFGSLLFGGRPLGPIVQGILVYGFWFLLSTNPIGTAIATEIILMQEQTAFFFDMPYFSGSGTFWLISPWLPYIIFSLGGAILMILGSILAVRRAER